MYKNKYKIIPYFKTISSSKKINLYQNSLAVKTAAALQKGQGEKIVKPNMAANSNMMHH